jgi:prepilin signal peptidase PulO-like enzyme (type II secretory pathway)
MQFYLYNFIVALIAFAFIIMQVIFILRNNPKYLTKTFLFFVYFIGLLILCEIYLKYRFEPKG